MRKTHKMANAENDLGQHVKCTKNANAQNAQNSKCVKCIKWSMPKNDVGQYVNCKQNANVGSLGLFAGIRLYFVGSPAVIYLCVCFGKTKNDNFRRQVLCGADLFKQKRSKYIFNHYTLLITRCGYSLCRSCAQPLRRAHGALEASKPWTQVPQNENESVYDHCKQCGSGDAPLGNRLGSTQPPLQQQRLCVVGLAWGGGGGESDAVL
jgi:hypothetical protein